MALKKKPGRDRLAGLRDPGSYLEKLERSQAQERSKDRHKNSVALAVRVPPALAAWVRGQAEAEGLTVNAWLTRLIELAQSGKPPGE